MQHIHTVLILAFAATLVAGCGVDGDLLNSAKAHLTNIQETAAKLEAEPDSADLKKQLAESASYFRTVLDSAGDGSKSALEDAVFAGMDAAKVKKLKELIYKTR